MRIVGEHADLAVSQQLENIIRVTEYDKHLEDNEKSEERQSNVDELLLVAAHHPSGATLRDFLDGITLLSEQDRLSVDKDSQDTITLITLHQTKGLEYPVVFIAGVE